MVAGGDAEHRGLAERRLGPGGVVRPHGPDVRRQQERPPARLVGRQVVGEGLELRRERRGVARRRRACRAAAPARGGTPGRSRWRATAPRAPRRVSLGDRVLGDAHRERRGEAGVVFSVARRRSARRAPRAPCRPICSATRMRALATRASATKASSSAASVATRSRARSSVAAARSSWPSSASRFGGAQPRVDHARGLADPVRNAERVAACRVGQRLLHERGESPRVRPRGSPRALRASSLPGIARVIAHAAARAASSPSTSPPSRARAPPRSAGQGGVDPPAAAAHPRAVEQQQRAPRRRRRELGALRERLLARPGVARATGEDLERQPRARELGRRRALYLRGRRGRALFASAQVVRDIADGRRRASAARATFSSGAVATRDERVDELARGSSGCGASREGGRGPRGVRGRSESAL